MLGSQLWGGERRLPSKRHKDAGQEVLDCRGTGGLDCCAKKCSTVMGQETSIAMDKRSRLSRQEMLGRHGQESQPSSARRISTVGGPLANAGAFRLRPRPATRSVSTVGRGGPPWRRRAPAWWWRLAARVRRMRLYIGSPYLEGSRKISSRRHGEAVESDFARRPWSVSATWLLRLPPGANHRMDRWLAAR